jgi:hypothetical protein
LVTSGEPRRAFARRHGLTVSQFDYWKTAGASGATANHAVGFAPVQVVDRPRGERGVH